MLDKTDAYSLTPKERAITAQLPKGVNPALPFATLLAARIAHITTSDTETARMFNDLQCSTTSSLMSNEDGRRACARIVSAMSGINENESADILTRIALNGFSVTDEILQPVGLACFLRGSFFNHSCNPTLTQSFVFEDDSVTLHLRTNRSLCKGEELTIAYMDVCGPTWWRRAYLLHHYGFHCFCDLCCIADPLIDAFRCTVSDCTGAMLPIPLNYSNYSNETTFTDSVSREYLTMESLPPPIALHLVNDTCSLCCSKCLATCLASDLFKAFHKTSHTLTQSNRGNLNPNERLMLIEKAVAELRLLVFAHHYSLLRALRDLATALIFVHSFDRAAVVTREYLIGLDSILDPTSPMRTLALLQLGRLLVLDVRSVIEGDMVMREVSRLISITHPSQHAVHGQLCG